MSALVTHAGAPHAVSLDDEMLHGAREAFHRVQRVAPLPFVLTLLAALAVPRDTAG